MPSNLPSSFASAAAGQNATSRSARNDRGGGSGGDWRDGRSTNGTLTFRRSSTTPIGHSLQQAPPSDNSASTTISPAVSSTVTELAPARYSKEDLLHLYRPQQSQNPSRLFLPAWNPNRVHSNGSSHGWGKGNDNHVPQEPGACWEANGHVAPISLQEMSSEEKEAFSADINSPLKPPTLNKDGAQPNPNHRKTSISQGSGANNNFGLSSPTSATRPGTRRRETLESNPFSAGSVTSPTANRGNRDDQPFWPPRRSGDTKESEDATPASAREPPSKNPFGSLIRSHTAGSPNAAGSGGWPHSTQAASAAQSPGGFGAFAMSSTIGDKRPAGTGTSRLAHLIPKEASESKSNDAAAAAASTNNQQSWRPRPRTDTDPFGDDGLSGSAVLGGAQDTGSGTPQHGSRVQPLGTPVKGSASDFGMSGLHLGGGQAGGGGQADLQISPSETNPYQSPPADRAAQEEGLSGAGGGAGGNGGDRYHGMAPGEHAGLSFLTRGLGGSGLEGSDRSQTSSVGASKGFPLPGVSAGWPAPGPGTGTPDRERPNYGAAFGGSLFNPLGGDIQSPSLGSNFNNIFGPPSAGVGGTGSIGRGSKLAALMPTALQQSQGGQGQENEGGLSDSMSSLRQTNPLGAIGRNNTFGVPSRDSESPLRSDRGIFGHMFPSNDAARAQRAFNAGDSELGTPVSGGLPFGGLPQISTDAHGNQIRQMVMPDRMRWVYLDPQGQIQGPFTGLEMNDWYKANFFTPDLRVKKVEDPDFEPLGQLIRRIGNSREPFLVPQIGIAHGQPNPAGPFTPTTTNNGVVPPLSGIFPSFGRTLTAEEQNNLERRKQEEQFLMAQQREFMVRQQVISKYSMGPGLQHHSSAQSLHSQPSFGSMTAPGGPQQGSQQPPIGPGGGFFDLPAGSQAGAGRNDLGNGDYFSEADLAKMSNAERQMHLSLDTSDDAILPPIGAPGSHLRSGLPGVDELGEDPEGFRERLKEFEEYRAQEEAKQAQAAAQSLEYSQAETQNERAAEQIVASPKATTTTTTTTSKNNKKKREDDGSLSLTQQVQKAQAAAAAAAQPPEPGMPMPFPPPTSTTPLPAPTAQRARSNLPEQYSRSQTGTPDDGSSNVPPLAPWAKDPSSEAGKGPSLKEIQEAEARKAAKAEQVAAGLRKAAMEQEIALLKEKERNAAAAAAAAGLPATSTWGHGSPVSANTPWTKPTAPVVPAAPGLSASANAAANKKTLAEIQREEELRKQKAKEVTVAQGLPAGPTKSYASFAGKADQHAAASQTASPSSTGAPVASGWATVGAGGKVKIPTGPAAQNRAVSATTAKPSAPAAIVKPVSRPGPAALNGKSEANMALEEFNKWVGRELSRGITGVDVASFQATLDVLPLDSGIIADAVYANSTTMDGRHFAEEYIRRKKLAERGVVERQPSSSADANRLGNNAGGWSEVAKKGGNPAASTGAGGGKDSGVGDAASAAAGGSAQIGGFKVVPSRKKGKK